MTTDPQVTKFEDSYGFRFDPFQKHACEVLLAGSSLLVAAPTGSGKTVVGEFAAWLAATGGGKTFYTTPIKALSNQKYQDLSAIHGADNVGLLTGDNSINGGASVVVMTTEILRNMIYEDSSDLNGLRFVVLDEVHYLQNPYRGAVWEEVLIHLAADIQTIALSATVSNAEEFAEWLQTLRGRVEVIIEERRPVELRQWYMASDELIPMFVRRDGGDPIPNPRGRQLERRRRHQPRPNKGGKRPREKRVRIPLRSDVIDRLASEDMLPGIYFIFSRKGCDQAVKQCIQDGIRLTSQKESEAIVAFAEDQLADFGSDELDLLGYETWIEGLARGISSHHAGMIPPFKETVEKLFNQGLLRAVFATETLALGINMPARTVVIESLMKFTGETHEQMTPGEFTQLGGRAGRRGIDELGHVLVLMQRFTRFDEIIRLASTRTYPLRSSFQPSYNMAVNLVRNYDKRQAEHLVNSSFAQFQTDHEVVRLEQLQERDKEYLASYRARAASTREGGGTQDLAGRTKRLQRQIDRRRSRIDSRTGTLAKRFDAVVEVLANLGYIDGWSLTSKGEALARVYNEADLLVVESLEAGLFDTLDAPELAAVLSTVIYEARGPDPPVSPGLPTAGTKRSWKGLLGLLDQISQAEEARGLALTREPEAGFAHKAHQWASGLELAEVLATDDTPGDFVRTVKQLVDLLRQLQMVTDDDDLRDRLRNSELGLHRSIVAFSSLEF